MQVVDLRRTALAPGRHREHAAMLAAWIKSIGFRRVVSLSTLPIHARREAQLADPEVMRAVQTSAVAADDYLGQPPLALRLEPELQADPAIWRPRSSTVLLHDEAERRGVAQTTLLRFCEVKLSPSSCLLLIAAPFFEVLALFVIECARTWSLCRSTSASPARWCSYVPQEGNNIPDGVAMAHALAKSTLIPGVPPFIAIGSVSFVCSLSIPC